MGILFQNENLSEDMISILKKFQSHLAFTSINGDKRFVNQLCVGDQLSNEKAVNCFEGFNIQLGDWDTGVKILEVM